MHKNAMIYNELKALNSPLADLPNTNILTVPNGYFDSLSSTILHIINDQRTIGELDIPALNIQVPEGYFNGLAKEIMDKIKSGAPEIVLAEEPDLLAAVRHLNVFTVPKEYFEDLAENVLAKLPQQPARVVSLKSHTAFFKYAVAAAITGIIGLGIFSAFDKKSPATAVISPAASIAFADNEVLKKAAEILKNNNFDKTMEALGDEEIVGYLQNNGEDLNAALVAAVTDEKNLPSEDAYFMDEKTLDNFLDKEHIVQTSNN